MDISERMLTPIFCGDLYAAKRAKDVLFLPVRARTFCNN